MSDEERRELERALAASPDDVGLREKLKAARKRDGISKPLFPPRQKLSASERPRDRWCPVCGTWNLRKTEQKFRAYRGRHGTADAGRVIYGVKIVAGMKRKAPTRFCTGNLPAQTTGTAPGPTLHRTLTRPAQQEVHDGAVLGGGPWLSPMPIDITQSETFKVELSFPAASWSDRPPRCPGPAKGQPCRPPLEALEARLVEVNQQAHFSPRAFEGEISWLRHRVAREKARLVRLGLRAPDPPPQPPPHVCRQRELDYAPGDRTKLVCKTCKAEWLLGRDGELRKAT